MNISPTLPIIKMEWTLHFTYGSEINGIHVWFKTGWKNKKNDKIQRWRVELACYIFDIKYRPGRDNVTADTLSRAYCSAVSLLTLVLREWCILLGRGIFLSLWRMWRGCLLPVLYVPKASLDFTASSKINACLSRGSALTSKDPCHISLVTSFYLQ